MDQSQVLTKQLIILIQIWLIIIGIIIITVFVVIIIINIFITTTSTTNRWAITSKWGLSALRRNLQIVFWIKRL